MRARADRPWPTRAKLLEYEYVFMHHAEKWENIFPTDKEKIMLEGEPQIFLIILRILQKKLKANPESTIAVLCRTNNPVRGDDDMTISEFSKRLEKFIEPKHSDQVTVNTVHRYKGKEADCVIR